MSKTIRVGVYGTLRSGEGNHSLMYGSKFIGKSTVPGTLHDLGAFPALDIEGEGTVTVEVYDIDEVCFRRLDRLEGYPSFYTRTELETADFGKAWVYNIPRERDVQKHSVIKSGDWLCRC